MKAKFRLDCGVGEGEVVKENPLTTLIRVQFKHLDVNVFSSMGWKIQERVIKRHNRKHNVTKMGVVSLSPAKDVSTGDKSAPPLNIVNYYVEFGGHITGIINRKFLTGKIA